MSSNNVGTDEPKGCLLQDETFYKKISLNLEIFLFLIFNYHSCFCYFFVYLAEGRKGYCPIFPKN